MSHVLALDQGTTSSRALVFDHSGRVCAMAQREFPQYFPRSGWVEHDPTSIWETQLAVAQEAIAGSGVAPGNIAALGITNQRETTLLWDRRTGEPVAPAIVWQDRRTTERCAELRAAGLSELIRQRTGLVLDAYFSGTKLEWLLNNIPGARARAERGELAFGTVDSWLVWKLTGGRRHVSDVTNAARTMLFDINRLQWDKELLSIFNIPHEVLPTICGNSEVIGHADPELLGAAIPIAGMAGDQQAATFGQACLSPGMAKNTYGTGSFLLLNTGGQAVASRNRLVSTIAWKLGNDVEYALEGSVFMAGAIVQWLRDGLGIIARSAEVETLAASVKDTEGLYLVPAFTGLGAPWWEGHARASLTGMSRNTNRAHLARAALEAIAYQTCDLVTAMAADGAASMTELRVDGGAATNDLLMQFQADMLGVPVLRPRVTETTALGAACLAGLAVGFWSSPGELAQHWQLEKRFDPSMGADEREQRLAGWRRAVRHTIALAQEN